METHRRYLKDKQSETRSFYIDDSDKPLKPSLNQKDWRFHFDSRWIAFIRNFFSDQIPLKQKRNQHQLFSDT